MRSTFRVTALGLLLALATSAQAQSTTYVLRVPIADPTPLVDAGYTIDHVVPGASADVYATAAERDALAAAGYTFEEIEKQPLGPAYSTGAKGLGMYSSYASLTADLQNYAAAHPAIARLVTLGQSVQGRELWALFISDNPDDEEAEPEFKYIATMHGDEQVGTEMCLYLIDRLLNDYGVDSRITNIVNSTAIWFLPLMNPDGLELGQRFNANSFDLNRSFPQFPFDFTGRFQEDDPLDTTGRQPEVRHIMNWTAANSFVLSANFHGGALVVNYPYDHVVGIPSGSDAPSEDDLLFKEISLEYSVHNPPMFASFAFNNGITNGSDWFSITGGMQDWNYRYMGCNAVLVELSNSKTPLESTLPTFWAQNEESMLSYLETLNKGVRGIVTKSNNGAPLDARIRVVGNMQDAYTDPDVGDYYRMLPAGTYTLVFESLGYYPKTFSNVVVTGSTPTVINVQLEGVNFPVGQSPWRIALLLLVASLGALYLARRARRKPAR